MKSIWLITVGEPLPIGREQSQTRMLRTGILAKALAARGHCVTWWTSTFDHTHKTHHHDKSERITSEYGYQIVLLHGMSYSKNISLRRIANHYQVAKDFAKLARQELQPDVIFCSYPTIELSLAAVSYGQRNKLPVIIDVRDLWPDIFLDAFPKYLIRLGTLFLEPYMFMSRKVFRGCTAITAVSEGYLEWGLSRGDRPRREKDAVFVLGYQRPSVGLSSTDSIRSKFEEMGVDESLTICWFIGTFGRTYDLVPIIEAARILESMGQSDIQFVFSGDGENSQYWRQLANGLNNVIFTGWIDNQQLGYLLSVADIGLMAYAKGAPQGLPNKIFEYLSEGIPIISSLQRETATFFVEHGCGMTYDAGNSISFLNTLERMLASNYKKIGHKGKNVFDEKYSADVVYSQLAEYLENVGCK
ncbi:MAG: glycosyltransferase family 4 protein [Desulfuromonadaceae bacterium]|nr:glycosyltransferase family 4 protein [Desulfuromonadaceae bacterium]